MGFENMSWFLGGGGGIDCGDRAVASDAGGPGLKSSHQNFFIKHCLLQTVEKIKIK